MSQQGAPWWSKHTGLNPNQIIISHTSIMSFFAYLNLKLSNLLTTKYDSARIMSLIGYVLNLNRHKRAKQMHLK